MLEGFGRLSRSGRPFSLHVPRCLPSGISPPSEVSLKTLWIRHLPWSLSRNEVRAALRAAAPEALDVTLPPPKGKARGLAAASDHRGHALVTFSCEDEADAAMQALERLESLAGHCQQGR